MFSTAYSVSLFEDCSVLGLPSLLRYRIRDPYPLQQKVSIVQSKRQREKEKRPGWPHQRCMYCAHSVVVQIFCFQHYSEESASPGGSQSLASNRKLPLSSQRLVTPIPTCFLHTGAVRAHTQTGLCTLKCLTHTHTHTGTRFSDAEQKRQLWFQLGFEQPKQPWGFSLVFWEHGKIKSEVSSSKLMTFYYVKPVTTE